MTGGFTGWIDTPVIDAIDYFSGIMQTFLTWATHYAQVIGLIGLCWSAFRLANSRFTIRDFWWDTFYKWFLFFALMSFYVPVSLGLSVLGNRIGIYAGDGERTISKALEEMRNGIEKDLATEKQWEEELCSDLQTNFDSITMPDLTEGQSYSDYMDSVYESVKASKFKSAEQKKAAKEKVEEYRNKNADSSIYGAKTLKAINEVLCEKNIDGTDGDILTDSYIPLKIWLQDSSGNDSYYISPAALLRVATLGVQVLWEKNQLDLAVDIDDIDDSTRFMKKQFSKLNTTIHHIPAMVMTILICIGIIACTIFSDIQYVMTILEYTIVTGIGAFFIPFILFDGTKELPKKLVPVFTGFMMKMIVMNIIIFFIFNELITMTIQIISDSGGINWTVFAGNAFFIFLAFILSANGPKIAQTIMTGQPQLSMGEVVQMGGALAAAAFKGRQAAKKTGQTAVRTAEMAKGTARGTVLAGINTAGGIRKMAFAKQSAASYAMEHGAAEEQAKKIGVKGMFAAVTDDLKDKIAGKGNAFLHGSIKKGTAPGGGNASPGSSPHQRNGQDTRRETEENSRILSTTSNPGFRGASRYDEKTQSLVNETIPEFLSEKADQGKMTGQLAAEKYMDKAKVKVQAPEIPNELPDNLTGKERYS